MIKEEIKEKGYKKSEIARLQRRRRKKLPEK
jgi:hypothetical protein